MKYGVNEKPRSSNRNPELFDGGCDRKITKSAQLRNYTGEFFEEATADLLRGRRLCTDGTYDVCPDVLIAPKLYAESKSVGQNASAIIYQCRLEKDLAWTKAHGGRLFYVFWNHELECNGVRFVSALGHGLAACLRRVVIVELPELVQICRNRPKPRVLNTAYHARSSGRAIGYAKYGVGWSLPISLIQRFASGGAAEDLWRSYTPAVQSHGVKIPPAPLFISSRNEKLLGINPVWA